MHVDSSMQSRDLKGALELLEKAGVVIRITQTSGSIALPIEVKAGKTGTFRSMHIYLEKYCLPAGIRVSQLEFNKTTPVISIPFYAIKRIAHLMKNL